MITAAIHRYVLWIAPTESGESELDSGWRICPI
jgi:hypothetical protein